MWDDDARRLLTDVVARGSAPEVEASLASTRLASTRFAENEITQSLSEETATLSVRAAFGKRTARVSTDRLSEPDVARALASCAELARTQPEDPQLLPLPDPVAIEAVERYDAATATASAEDRARLIGQMIEEARDRGLTLAGVLAHSDSGLGIANNRGLYGYHRESQIEFSVTAQSAAGPSGWAKATETSQGRMDVLALARRAMDKARAGQETRVLEPGAYTTILEPSAVTDLLGFLFAEWGGQAIAEHRSFLTGRVGEKVFGENVTIVDDVRHPAQNGPPFDGEGVPRQRVTLVDRGVVAGAVYSRGAAAQAGRTPTGHGFPLPNELGEMPANIVMEGGSTDLADMIASTERGILVTRFWYVREVDPMSKLLTGMTRDGTFLIEDGRVRYGLRDLRFNQGLLDMLRAVVERGSSVRASGEEGFDMVVPPLKVAGFHFTGVAGV
jgi:predicted Zn-dependent protease